MPPNSPTGDGGWDPAKDAPTTASSGSASKGIWDLGDLDPKTPITIDYGNPYSRMPKQLPAEDRDQASRAPSIGLPADLLKQPIRLFAQNKDGYLILQHALFDGGFYGTASSTSIAFGAGIDATLTAWRRALTATAQAQSAGLNLTPEDVIRQAAEDRRKAAGKAPTGPLIVEHEDPHALAGMLQQAAQAALGHDLSDQEVEHFISEYKSAEDAYYKQRLVASNATAGRVDLTRPDPSAQAKSFVQGEHGTEAAGDNLANYVGALEGMLKGG